MCGRKDFSVDVSESFLRIILLIQSKPDALFVNRFLVSSMCICVQISSVEKQFVFHARGLGFDFFLTYTYEEFVKKCSFLGAISSGFFLVKHFLILPGTIYFVQMFL